MAWVISGSAPLSEDLGHFLHGAGLTVMEGWGLTETVGPITMNRPAFQRIGSAGLPLPGCVVRSAGVGELEVQGPDVFQGYWQDPPATAEAFDGRWLRTGDLGRVDGDGYVYVTGRKKELIITAGGQHVVPSVLEEQVREHWLIAECVVVGDRRPYVGALVTLDETAFARWKQREGRRLRLPAVNCGRTRVCVRSFSRPWTGPTSPCPGPRPSSGSASCPASSRSAPS